MRCFVRMSVPAQDLRTIPAPVRELGSGPPFPEGGGPSAPTSGEPDWQSLFERERRRAEEWRRGDLLDVAVDFLVVVLRYHRHVGERPIHEKVLGALVGHQCLEVLFHGGVQVFKEPVHAGD